jgi:L-alanine-DL-glutamate epimerase-like enolase superfamily enzyme
VRIERVERLRVDRWLFVRIYTDSGLVGLGEAGMWGYPDATARAISLPIATGERLQNIWEFRELLACGGARYLRIDPAWPAA